MLGRFYRLMQDIERGGFQRNTFQPWEITILLDLRECNARLRVTHTLLDRYQKAVRKHIEKGAHRPITLSEYLERNARRAAARSEELSYSSA